MEALGLTPASFDLGWLAAFVPPTLLALLLLAGLYAVRAIALRSITASSTRYHARKVITYGGYFIIALLLLSTTNARLAQFTVIVGAVGAGVAFALQEVIASIAGWFAISFGNFYKPGDRVRLGGIKGDVIDIGFLRTTLMELGDWVDGDLYNGRVVRVANSFVFKEPVYNYSHDFPFLWDEFKLPVRYGSDRTKAETIIRDAIAREVGAYTSQSTEDWNRMVRHYLIEQARIEPMVTLTLTDNWVEFTARYIVDYKQRRATKDAIMRSILDAIEASEGAVQLGSATYELVGLPPLRMEKPD